MAPLNWDQFMKLSPDDLVESDDSHDLYDTLADFDPGSEDDNKRLLQLFEVTRAIMLFKGTQAEIAEEELAEKATTEGKSSAKRDQEIEDLKRDLEALKRENKDLKRFGGDSSAAAAGGRGGDQARFLKDELNTMESQVSALTKEMKEIERALREEKETSERYYQRATTAEQDLRELRRENERMQDDVRDYQRQLESQREALVNRRDDEQDSRDKITQKNKILVAALEENRNLAEHNVELEKKIDDLKREMKEGQREIDHTTDKCLQLREVADSADKMVDNLRRDNEVLKHQIEDLTEQARSKTDADDEIMAQLNNEVEKWREILDDKNQHIMDLEAQLMKMKDQLTAANIDSEKTSVAMLTKAVEDRDKQIERLQKNLDDATFALDQNTALMDDVRGDMMKTGKGPGDRQHQRILSLQNALKMHESQLKDAEKRAQEAEDDARTKDKQLSEALERMHQYEAGEYGLAEAVAEIKEHKQQIQNRERNIEELTQYINKVELQVNDLYDENEDLRERLGMDRKEPIDLTAYRKKKGLRVEEERALNRILQREVETMEEERIGLKQQIRKLAQATGQKAVAMGLSADDMVEVDRFIDELKDKRAVEESRRKLASDADREHLKIKNIQLDADLEKNVKRMDRLSTENAELKAKTNELEEENQNLEKGMREIHAAIKEQGTNDPGDIRKLECPTLDRMLAAIDAKNMMGRHDTSLFLKAQVDNLTGHVEELRKELKEARYESTRATVDLDKAANKVDSLQSELKMLREVGAGALLQTIALPEGMSLTSSDVIASLNEHLVQTLQELSLKEETLTKMESALDTYRRKFAVVRHQQSLLYQDYISDKKEWEDAKDKLEKSLAEVQGAREDDVVRLQEFDRLTDTLSRDDSEVRRRVAEVSRKVTVLRVNEKALARRYTALQDVETTLRKDVRRLRTDMIAMETAVSERLGYLQRHKDMATFKISALQKALDDTVPAADLDDANRQYTELTEKYRDLLEQSNGLVVTQQQNNTYEAEITQSRDENASLRRALEVEKEKLHSLEGAFEQLRQQGLASTSDLSDSAVLSMAQRLTTLEMKELHERERAEHADVMYQTQKGALRTLEDRNMELEHKFSELTKINLGQQKVERNLRDELATCVTKTVSDADRRKISQLELHHVKLQDEVSKLKDVSEVAMTQVRAVEATQQSYDKEVTSLRQQLVDFQAQSDEKTVIGKLHRHIVHLQVSEGTAVRKLEDAMKKIIKLEAHVLRAEQKIDGKDQTIYHNRLEGRSKTKYLKHTIQDLRRRYAGSVPLQTQEKFSQNLVSLTSSKREMEHELNKAREERLGVEDRLEELRLQHVGLQELIATLKDSRGAAKVTEWHGKMEAVRLDDLKLKREIERLKYQVKFQEDINKKHEMEVLSLEEDKVKMAREFEERELQWERREVELERMVANMERQQAEIAGAANQFEAAIGALPDTNWPVSKQLDEAVSTIKRNVKLIMDAKAETEHYRKRLDELEKELREREREVLKRDRAIADLRLRMPATSERDQMVLQVTSKNLSGKEPTSDYEGKQAIRAAHSTVNSLQARIAQKEETVQKYQELLQQARDEMVAVNRRHDDELRSLQEQLHANSDHAFNKFKQGVSDTLNRQQAAVPTNEQLRRLNELEDMLAEQDNALAAQRDKLAKSRQETQDWRYKYDGLVRQHGDEHDRLLEEHASLLGDLDAQVSDLQRQLSDQQAALTVTQTELDSQKEANTRAPTTTMKGLVERLRNQLALKEKQHKALSRALMELRGDMVQQAKDDVKANIEKTATENSVAKVVEKHTKDLHETIEDLESQNTKLKKEVKKKKDRELTHNMEVEELRTDLQKRENQVRKLKEDKSRLETESEDLEKKIERMSTMSRQKGPSEAVKHELEDLRRKNRVLQEEVKKSKHQAEKPYEQQAKDGNTDNAVARWEESKKWQKMVDRLKGRVRDKEQELERITKTHDLAKAALDRANKDKESLESKLRAATRAAPPDDMIKPTLVAQTSAAPRGPMAHKMQDLKRKNHDLEEELSRLRRETVMSRDKAYEEVTMRNQFLSERLEQLEQQMSRRLSAAQDGAPGPSSAAYKELLTKEQEQEKKLIRLSEENIEMRFELEAVKKDLPRLKDRISDQQKYIEILKTEKDQLMEVNTVRSQSSFGSSLGSLSANIRRIGESGRSTRDLEKTISLLKKVVEKTQAENQQLKKAPGVVTNDQLRMVQLENKGLKDQVEEMRQKFGASLSDRYQSQQKGTAKLMADFEKLRRDLMKEMETNEKLRIKLKQQEISTDQLQTKLDAAKDARGLNDSRGAGLGNSRGAGLSDSRGASLPGHEARAWRLAEEKVRAQEEELKQKNKTLSDVKLLLREAAEREQQLLQEREDLANKVDVLENFPPGVNPTDAGIAREYQQSRLRIDRLENEKKELIHEVQVLRKRMNAVSAGTVDLADDEVLAKVMSHDKLATDNVDLRTQLKAAHLAKKQLETHNSKMKAELDNFGPDFFDEIEDLKYNYREAVQKNVQYEEQLSQLSKQFGVDVSLPGV